MVAGEGAAGALPAALVAARRLSRRGATALVDLGPSPSWLADLFDRERDGGARTGLSDLVADPQARGSAHRDLSTALDIIPSGDGAVAPDDLPAALEALARAYAFVVVHAADWRSRRRRRAAADMAAMLLVAAGRRKSAAVEARARAASGRGLAIKAIPTGAPVAARTEAA